MPPTTTTAAAPACVRAASARRAKLAGIALAGLGIFVALGVVGALAAFTRIPWLLGSFGASCVLLFGFPDAPFSRPRSVIGGHVIASATGLVFLHVFGPAWPAMAAAGAVAAMLMMLTDTVHPPAGSNPVIVFLGQPGWAFLVLPTLAGACLLVMVAKVYRRVARRA